MSYGFQDATITGMDFTPGKITGTRDELLTELHRAKEGWHHYGKRQLASDAEAGFQQLIAGESSVQVGHIEYSVTD